MHAEPPAQREANVRVLVVDDDGDVAALTGEYLDREDAVSDVVIETDPRAALETIESSPHLDAIVCDFKMPGMDGLELSREIDHHRPGLAFVLFTGSARQTFKSRPAVEDVDALVTKGGDGKRYRRLVTALLDAAT